MPELPEVETIVRGLNKKIRNKIIKSVEIRVPKLIKLPNTKFVHLVGNQKIIKVSRRAKLIKVKLSNKKVLLIHLKLTGQLIYSDKAGKLTAGGHLIPQGLENLPNKFTHIIFTFKDNSHLFYNDLRKFGWMDLISQLEIDAILTRKYGIEPLTSEFTLNRFKEILNEKKSQNIKKFLLDQENIAGLGNIYVDESCFYASIRPMRKVGSLSQEEIKKLWQGIRSILKSAIKHHGTSVNTYLDASGRPGGYVSRLKVYGRAGESCKRQDCSGVIKKIKLNSRGTHYCPECQR
jgi:formamidopyrimidine-DNA glycosylase